MAQKTLPGTPTANDIQKLVQEFGAEAVQVWLLIQMRHITRKSDLIPEHLKGQWTYTAGQYALRYQELNGGYHEHTDTDP